jgi:hypothetical protein
MNFESFNADDTFDLNTMVDEVETHQPEQTDEGEAS